VATDTTPDRFLLHETGAGAQAWMGRNLITIKGSPMTPMVITD